MISNRRFCRHLQLSGETQAIDRILYQMSLRFWNCNQEAQKNYITIGTVIKNNLQSNNCRYCLWNIVFNRFTQH